MSCALPMSAPNPSTAPDKNLAPMGPRIYSMGISRVRFCASRIALSLQKRGIFSCLTSRGETCEKVMVRRHSWTRLLTFRDISWHFVWGELNGGVSQSVPKCPVLSPFVLFCPLLSPFRAPRRTEEDKRGQNGTFQDKLGNAPMWHLPPFSSPQFVPNKWVFVLDSKSFRGNLQRRHPILNIRAFAELPRPTRATKKTAFARPFATKTIPNFKTWAKGVEPGKVPPSTF